MIINIRSKNMKFPMRVKQDTVRLKKRRHQINVHKLTFNDTPFMYFHEMRSIFNEETSINGVKFCQSDMSNVTAIVNYKGKLQARINNDFIPEREIRQCFMGPNQPHPEPREQLILNKTSSRRIPRNCVTQHRYRHHMVHNIILKM